MRVDWRGMPLPMRILLACVVAVVLAALAGSLMWNGTKTAAPDAASTVTTATSPASGAPAAEPADRPAERPRFSTETVPGGFTTSPQEVYELSVAICGSTSAREVAAEYHMSASNHERIAVRFSRGYVPALRAAAAAGCGDGLAAYAKQHRERPAESPPPPPPASIRRPERSAAQQHRIDAIVSEYLSVIIDDPRSVRDGRAASATTNGLRAEVADASRACRAAMAKVVRSIERTDLSASAKRARVLDAMLPVYLECGHP